MYLPLLHFHGFDFSSVRGDGFEGFSFPYLTAAFRPIGVLREEDFSRFMLRADSAGMTVHHISTRWGVVIPRSVYSSDAVIFHYDGKFGVGYALAFRTADGFADLWYVLNKES